MLKIHCCSMSIPDGADGMLSGQAIMVPVSGGAAVRTQLKGWNEALRLNPTRYGITAEQARLSGFKGELGVWWYPDPAYPHVRNALEGWCSHRKGTWESSINELAVMPEHITAKYRTWRSPDQAAFSFDGLLTTAATPVTEPTETVAAPAVEPGAEPVAEPVVESAPTADDLRTVDSLALDRYGQVVFYKWLAHAVNDGKVEVECTVIGKDRATCRLIQAEFARLTLKHAPIAQEVKSKQPNRLSERQYEIAKDVFANLRLMGRIDDDTSLEHASAILNHSLETDASFADMHKELCGKRVSSSSLKTLYERHRHSVSEFASWHPYTPRK